MGFQNILERSELVLFLDRTQMLTACREKKTQNQAEEEQMDEEFAASGLEDLEGRANTDVQEVNAQEHKEK